MAIRLVSDASQSIDTIQKMIDGLANNKAMANSLEKAQRNIIERRVRRIFTTNKKKKPTTVYSIDRKKHEYVGGLGKFTKQIVDNIKTSSVIRRDKIVVGTGQVAVLDSQDPIKGLRRPRRKLGQGHYIWRFLESGTAPHPIVARTKKSLALLVLKETNAGLVLANIFKGAVRHPGYEGRHAFFKGGLNDSSPQPYNSDFKIMIVARNIMREYVKKFSAV